MPGDFFEWDTASELSMDVLNPWMLAGLAGVVLPVLIHLLARRRLPVIDWGAMQFLQMSPYSRRSFAIEDWLLLLLRMSALAVLALALARPWIRGNLLGWARWSPPRDVAVVLDGSFSTAIPDRGKPLHEELREDVRTLLGGLSAGSTMQIFDARDAVVPLLSQRTAAVSNGLTAMQDLRPPTGTSHLAHAVLIASRDLIDTTHVHRDVIVFADDQSRAWEPDNTTAWSVVDGQLRQAAVPPRVSLILRRRHHLGVDDVGWERASLSRERCVPGQTVTVQGQLKNWGSTPQQRRVWCVLNGRSLAEHQTTVRLPPSFATPVSFEVRLPAAGQHAIALHSESDVLPGNDHVEFVAEAVSGVNVLLVDGTPGDDPLQSETFFARAALQNTADPSGWINMTATSLTELQPDLLPDQKVVVLANVSKLGKDAVTMLEAYVAHGGAVVVTLGNQSGVADDEDVADWDAWLPVELQEWHDPAAVPESVTQVAADSLTLPWLERFHPDRGGELCDALFRGWWTTKLQRPQDGDKPLVVARFTNSDPWMVSARRGKGTLMVVTSTLDADGNTLPAKPDYVAWLHELILVLSEPPQRRNIAVGEMMHRRSVANNNRRTEWLDPWGTNLPTDDTKTSAVARWPGIYVVTAENEKRLRSDDPQLLCGSTDTEAFAAQSDLAESDRTVLTDAERLGLSAGGRLRFYETVQDWQRQQAADAPRSELAWPLLWIVLGVLMIESLITHRRAQRTDS